MALVIIAVLAFPGCGPRTTAVDEGNANQTLYITVGAEPENIDPHVVSGVPEHHIITSLIEGLVAEDPKDLHVVPGVAESWEVSEDGLVYTFHLRDDAMWTHGRAVTADDFVQSFRRILTASLGSTYSYMLFPMKNAEEYLNGTITDFSEVGCRAIDERNLEITLKEPTPYFLSLLNHYTWFPVPMDVVQKHGDPYLPGNRWTLPGNFSGNGPFKLESWEQNNKLVVVKSETYWDSDTTRLNSIVFRPMEKSTSAEAAFRTGQLHNIYNLPQDFIAIYKRDFPEVLHMDPHLAVYFYRFNTTREPLNDPRVRKALAMAISRQEIVDNVAKAGQPPALSMVPPDCAGYTSRARIEENIEQAQKLLADAGYPNGEGFPDVELLYNTDEGHRNIAEAIQQIWSRNLNINVTLDNQEWKVYLDSQRSLDYGISRAGWTGDYPDPNTFLDMWTSWSEQNQTGWSNPEYDRLIREASNELNPETRYEYFQKAEEILADEMPVMPIYFYTRVYALRPEVKGWYSNHLDHHPWKHIYLEP
jgi:oligopeptide transport system substrate-binding protein